MSCIRCPRCGRDRRPYANGLCLACYTAGLRAGEWHARGYRRNAFVADRRPPRHLTAPSGLELETGRDEAAEAAERARRVAIYAECVARSGEIDYGAAFAD